MPPYAVHVQSCRFEPFDVFFFWYTLPFFVFFVCGYVEKSPLSIRLEIGCFDNQKREIKSRPVIKSRCANLFV
jgi:hypothetical protein